MKPKRIDGLMVAVFFGAFAAVIAIIVYQLWPIVPLQALLVPICIAASGVGYLCGRFEFVLEARDEVEARSQRKGTENE